MQTIDREHSCAFTGHRPERLGIPESNAISWLDRMIEEAIEDGYTCFISGMQRGVDIWAAEAVLRLRNEGKPIRLISACAFPGMEKRWDSDWQAQYRRILDAADEVHYISDIPSKGAFFRRNHWMVDRASRLLAVYTGIAGGTKETIQYAITKSVEIISIADDLKEDN